MATHHAHEQFMETGQRVCIVDKEGNARTHDIWQHNPEIARIYKEGKILNPLAFNSSCRPYIQYDKITPEQWVWNTDYSVKPGKIVLGPGEHNEIQRLYKNKLDHYIIIDPHVKGVNQINKSWGFAKYQDLVFLNPNLPWVQFQYNNLPMLKGVNFIQTHSVRALVTYTSYAKAIVCNEGGLHHVAAALGIPGVVIFGGFIPSAITGYSIHTNIGNDEDHYCGRIPICAQCRIIMQGISVEQVHSELHKILSFNASPEKKI